MRWWAVKKRGTSKKMKWNDKKQNKNNNKRYKRPISKSIVLVFVCIYIDEAKQIEIYKKKRILYNSAVLE